MTPEQSDDLDSALDRFEVRVRRRWLPKVQRFRATRHQQIRDAMLLDDPRSGISAMKPSLDDYDGYGRIRSQFGTDL